MADFAVQEFFGDFEVADDSVDYSGTISISATAMNRHGQSIEIGYDVDVVATAGWEWESDEQPSGWNYSTDTPTYTSSEYAVASDVEISSVSFTPGQEFYIGDEIYSLHDAQEIIDPSVLKQLLNPQIYVPLIQPAINKKIEALEPPDKNDYDYDDYNDYRMQGDY